MEGQESPPARERKEKIITLNFTQKEWSGLYETLLEGLKIETDREVGGEYKHWPEKVKRLDYARKIGTELARNLPGGLLGDGNVLATGMTELIPEATLRQLAQNPKIASKQSMEKAQYFIGKIAKKGAY